MFFTQNYTSYIPLLLSYFIVYYSEIDVPFHHSNGVASDATFYLDMQAKDRQWQYLGPLNIGRVHHEMVVHNDEVRNAFSFS